MGTVHFFFCLNASDGPNKAVGTVWVWDSWKSHNHIHNKLMHMVDRVEILVTPIYGRLLVPTRLLIIISPSPLLRVSWAPPCVLALIHKGGNSAGKVERELEQDQMIFFSCKKRNQWRETILGFVCTVACGRKNRFLIRSEESLYWTFCCTTSSFSWSDIRICWYELWGLFHCVFLCEEIPGVELFFEQIGEWGPFAQETKINKEGVMSVGNGKKKIWRESNNSETESQQGNLETKALPVIVFIYILLCLSINSAEIFSHRKKRPFHCFVYLSIYLFFFFFSPSDCPNSD